VQNHQYKPNGLFLIPPSYLISSAVFQTSAMTKNDDNIAFSKRLKLALTRHPKRIENAADLALQFNLRHVNEPITSQAAYKWLTAKSKPAPDKIQTLAAWLNVPTHWLSFGSPENDDDDFINTLRQNKSHSDISDDEIRFIFKLRNLSDSQKHLVDALIDQIRFQKETPQK
jgi:transcriptional regulator with XRE-family HTH domain